MKCYLILISFTAASLFSSSFALSLNMHGGGHTHELARIMLSQDLSGDELLVEGFAEKVSGSELEYHSPLPENLTALLTRSTDGQMEIGWKTGIPGQADGPVHFLWLAGLGSNLGDHHFDLHINGRKNLIFSSSPLREWTVKGEKGSSLTFRASYRDVAGDLFGLMVLTLPDEAVQRGEPLELSVVGHAEGSNAWYMTFMYDRVVEALRKMKTDGFWYRLNYTKNTDSVHVLMPGSWAGKNVSINSGKSYELIRHDSNARAALPVDLFERGSLKLFADERMLDQLPAFSKESATLKVTGNGAYIFRSWYEDENRQVIESSTCFTSQFPDEIIKLSKGPLADATIELITSSHQDIAWMDDPQACKIMRDTMIIAPAIELLRKDPSYHYSAEQALMLYEYLDRHPGALSEIRTFSGAGRLEWGASFNQPYEGMYYGESLVRQFYLGRKWLKKQLPGYDPKVYFNIDVPGRTLQMPQIAKKSGVDYMIISRHEEGYFYWQSPDGSKIGVHSPGHYHHASDFLRHSLQEAVMSTPAQLMNRWETMRAYAFPAQLPVLLSSDMSRPMDMRGLFDAWNNIRVFEEDSGEMVKLKLPEWRYNTFQSVLESLFSQGRQLPVLKGERPNVWLYIHGPAHHWAISASREGGRLLPVAETFSTIAAVLNDDWAAYPQKALEEAWQAQIFPDHGWGGKDGHITDQLFREKAEFSRDEAHRLVRIALNDISGYIKSDPNKGIPLVVFNPLSWERNGLFEMHLRFERGQLRNFELVNDKGQPVEVEKSVPEYHHDGSLSKVNLVAVLKNLPSVGYTTLYAREKKEPVAIPESGSGNASFHENDYYRVLFDKGGIRSLFDKELKRELVNADRFLFGEVFALQSEGNGAGEFDKPQLPTTAYFERAGQYEPGWMQTEDNDLRTVFEFEQPLGNTVLLEKIIIYNTIKRIDVAVELNEWDGTKNREFRIAFPMNQKNGSVSYEVPMAKVTVGQDEIPGAAGERYQQIASSLHPREVLDWISSSGDGFGVTFSSDVAVWDYVDPTGNNGDYTNLQPVLLASRKSCHWEGNWYLQKGDHHYRFSFTSHEPGWEKGYRFGKEANYPVFSLRDHSDKQKASLPETFSFFGVSDANVFLSTLKKAEEGTDMVLRVYEMEGRDTDFDISWFRPLNTRVKTNLIEEAEPDSENEKADQTFRIGKQAIESWKLK